MSDSAGHEKRHIGFTPYNVSAVRENSIEEHTRIRESFVENCTFFIRDQWIIATIILAKI